MKKRILRLASLMLAVLLFSVTAASADLERGDRGDEVQELQRLLFETGWLFELPDGIFGGNTEQAIREFEAYADLPVDGVADDRMMQALAESHEALHPEQYAAEPEDSGQTEYPACCIQQMDPGGNSQTDYCEAHHTLHVQTYRMLDTGDTEIAQYASVRWSEEVGRLYDQWIGMTPEEEKGNIVANRLNYMASVEAQRKAYNLAGTSDSAVIAAEAAICQNLRNQAAWLCGVVWQLQNGGPAEAGTDEAEPVLLNSRVIVAGDCIYYSGAVDGVNEGVYVMDLNGGNVRRISEITAALAAESNGNLLVWNYADDGYGTLEVLCADGTLVPVSESFNGYAMADGGRFYYGGSSVAEDGTDHQLLLIDDPRYNDVFWPVELTDGCLYFLDTSETGSAFSFSGGMLPFGEATLNRLNLEEDSVDPLSGLGTRFIGIEDGKAYYVREGFDVYDEEGGVFHVEVDDGLYCMNLENLAETKIAESRSDQFSAVEWYRDVDNSVVYGEYTDYSGEEMDSRFICMQENGKELPAIELGDRQISIFFVENGMIYGLEVIGAETEDMYKVTEQIVMYDLYGDAWTEIALEEDESMYYSEMMPAIAVRGGRIYYYVMNWTEGREYLKSVALDGSDVQTLAQGRKLY